MTSFSYYILIDPLSAGNQKYHTCCCNKTTFFKHTYIYIYIYYNNSELSTEIYIPHPLLNQTNHNSNTLENNFHSLCGKKIRTSAIQFPRKVYNEGAHNWQTKHWAGPISVDRGNPYGVKIKNSSM